MNIDHNKILANPKVIIRNNLNHNQLQIIQLTKLRMVFIFMVCMLMAPDGINKWTH